MWMSNYFVPVHNCLHKGCTYALLYFIWLKVFPHRENYLWSKHAWLNSREYLDKVAMAGGHLWYSAIICIVHYAPVGFLLRMCFALCRNNQGHKRSTNNHARQFNAGDFLTG